MFRKLRLPASAAHINPKGGSTLNRIRVNTTWAFALLSASCLAEPQAPSPLTAGSKGFFIENRGQWDARAQFLCRTSGVNEWLTTDGMVFDFNKFTPEAGSTRKQPSGTLQGHVVKISFTNAKPTQVSGVKELEGKYNYLLGNDRTKWTTGARSFSEARAEQPYDGISVRYYTEQGRPRYDLIVKPGADPSQASLKVEGANGVRVLENGDLAIDTSLGTVEEKGLVAYQEQGGLRTPVNCRMVQENNTIRFDTGSYDPSKPLIIDPLVYSTMLGGTNSTNYVGGIAAAPSGDAVVAGYETSTDLPTSTGAYQTTDPSKFGVISVTELNSDGTGVVFSTFLGGSSWQSAEGVKVDASGNPVVVGGTTSDDFPVTANAYQKTNLAWPSSTAFVTKLNATGTDLVFSTLLGGADGPTEAYSLDLDTSGNVLVGGYTDTNGFPTTAGALQTQAVGESNFVAKLNSTGSALDFSTYLGSSTDSVTAVAFDKSGYAYIAGDSQTTDIPVSAGAYQTTNESVLQGGSRRLGGFLMVAQNGFVLKLNATGTGIEYGTYLGGKSVDFITGLAVDSVGNAVVGGMTASSDLPTTSGAFQASDHAGEGDFSGFVAKLNGSGTKLAFGTYLGGSKSTTMSGIALDIYDNVVVTGWTNSRDYPTTAGAYQTINPNETEESIVTQLKGNGTGILYSSLLGGTGMSYGDSGEHVAVNGLDQVLVAGIASSPDFPVTAGAWQTSVDTNGEGFAACFNLWGGDGSAVNNFTLPATAIAGSTVQGGIFLNGPTASAVTINFTGTGPISFTPQLQIQPGYTYVTTGVFAQSVTSEQKATVTATSGSFSLTRTIEVVPMAITYLSVNPSPVIGGNYITASMTLSGCLGLHVSNTVTVTTTGPVSTEATEQVQVGANYIDFSVHANNVTQPSPATLTVTMGSLSKTVSFNVYPEFETASLNQSTVIGGDNITGTVTTYIPAPASGIPIWVTPSSTTYVTGVGGYLYIQPGKTQATFTMPTEPCAASTVVKLVVSSGAQSLSLNVTLTTPPITGLTLPSSSTVGGDTVTAKVTIGGFAAKSGDVVSVASSSPDAVVPATVTIPKGAASTTFSITTKKVTSPTAVTITVKLGSSSYSSVLNLTP